MDKLKIVKGNTFETVVEIRAYKYNGEEITDFDLNNCTNISIINHVSNGETYRIVNYEILDAKHIQMRWDRCVVGDYSLEVTGKLGDDYWRFYDKKPIFSIVNTNAEAHIPQNSIIREDCYQVDKLKVYIVCPKGDKGDTGATGPRGFKGDKGDSFKYEDFTQAQLNSLKGALGDPGTPGLKGDPGITPHIGTNGNWFIGNTDTNVKAQGPRGLEGKLGEKGERGNDGLKGDAFTYSDFTAALLEALRGPLGEPGQPGRLGAAFTYADFTPELLAALKGEPGIDGNSPVITASKSGDTTIIYSDGTSIATINDGQDGTNGITPTITVTNINGGHNVAISYGTGDSRNANFDVMDGSLANQILSDWEETNTSSASYILHKPTIPTVPTNVSSFANDVGYLTSHQDISGKANSADLAAVATSGSYTDLINTPTIPSLTGYATETWVGQRGYLTSFTESDPTVPSWAKLSLKPSYTAQEVGALPANTPLFSGSYNDLSDKPSLATVATTGAYSDLTGTPTIPTVPSNESASSGGSTLSVVTTGEKYTWNNKASIWSGTQALYTALSPNYDSNTVYIITAS